MAALDTTRTNYGVASAANRLAAFTGEVFTAIIDWNDARATRKALSGLTDRELEDIGLVRGDIDSVARSYLIR